MKDFHAISKTCEYCDKPLKLNNTRDVVRKRFCSHACRQRWRYEHGDSVFDDVRYRAYSPESITKRNLPKGPKICTHCDTTFDPDSSRQRYCKTCVPDKSSRSRMKRYNISKPEWDALSLKQNDKCAICDNPPYAVDHCHNNGHVRGLLCDNCNRLLGKIETQEWPEWYERAKAYLSSK
jgi:hypothetical protein